MGSLDLTIGASELQLLSHLGLYILVDLSKGTVHQLASLEDIEYAIREDINPMDLSIDIECELLTGYVLVNHEAKLLNIKA